MLSLPLLLTFLAAAQTSGPPPDPTVPLQGARPVASVQGRGTQNYLCSAQPAGYAWTPDGPDADLYDLASSTAVGHHSAGPTWTWIDGSAVKGNVVATQPAPKNDTPGAPGNVPWLLLQTAPSGNTQGLLSHVLWVRRSETQGGAAPATGCDAAHAGTALRVPYTATYTFFTGTH